MDSIAAYMGATHAQLMQTVSLSVADMAMNSSAQQMQEMVNQINEIAPAVDGLGANLDVLA